MTWWRRPGGPRWLRRSLWLMLALDLLAILLVGADRPAKPHLLDQAVAAPLTRQPSRVAGFDQVAFRVVVAARGGAGRRGCALLADTADRQTQGLMGRPDLAGYDAMVFRFAADTSVPFYNKNVPIELSIAWFDAAGVYLGQAGLARCDRACPLVRPDQPFRSALEVPRGELGRLGIGQGAALVVGGSCP